MFTRIMFTCKPCMIEELYVYVISKLKIFKKLQLKFQELIIINPMNIRAAPVRGTYWESKLQHCKVDSMSMYSFLFKIVCNWNFYR